VVLVVFIVLNTCVQVLYDVSWCGPINSKIIFLADILFLGGQFREKVSYPCWVSHSGS